MNDYRTRSNRLNVLMTVFGAAWLLLISGLMIADVWDETNARMLFITEPVVSQNVFEATLAAWLHQLPLDIYRPMGSSVALALGKLFDGNFIWMRYFNALLMIGSAGLLAQTLVFRYEATTRHAMVFFLVLLFSGSSLITSTWFANIFDAACLFFLTMAIRLYATGHLAGCAIGFSLAVFCKESYVLAFPLIAWMMWEDLPRLEKKGRNARVWMSISIVGVSAVYWWVRHTLIPIGSEADIHGFNYSPWTYIGSTASFLSGFLSQTYTFHFDSPSFWIGTGSLLVVLKSARGAGAKWTMLAILGMSSLVYLGMFGLRDEILISSNNFIGRLYLIPFALSLFVIFAAVRKSVVLLVAAISVWGMGDTWRRHTIFQQTYAEVYEFAEATDATLLVHYPEKSLDDFQRGLRIGNFPDAGVRINVLEGGLNNN